MFTHLGHIFHPLISEKKICSTLPKEIRNKMFYLYFFLFSFFLFLLHRTTPCPDSMLTKGKKYKNRGISARIGGLPKLHIYFLA